MEYITKKSTSYVTIKLDETIIGTDVELICGTTTFSWLINDEKKVRIENIIRKLS